MARPPFSLTERRHSCRRWSNSATRVSPLPAGKRGQASSRIVFVRTYPLPLSPSAMPHTSPARARLQATLAAAGGSLLWWRYGGPAFAGLAGLVCTLALLAWLAPTRYAPVQRGFDFVTRALLAALTWFVLGVVYFGVFAPLRVWRAVTRHDPLQQRADPVASSYLQPLPPTASGHYDRQF
jgi:hypothetical protein